MYIQSILKPTSRKEPTEPQKGDMLLWDFREGFVIIERPSLPPTVQVKWDNGDNKFPASFLKTKDDFYTFAKYTAENHHMEIEKLPEGQTGWLVFRFI